MKHHPKAFLSLSVFFVFATTMIAQQQPFRPGGLAADDPALNNTAVTLTDEDLADPPSGEIRKRYLRDVNEVRSTLAANLKSAPAGPDGQQSPWMPKYQTLKSDLDQIALSRLQRDVFDLIPQMKEFFSAIREPGYSDFFASQAAVLRSLGVTVVHAIAEHVIDQNANVAAPDLANFVTVFSTSSFMSSSVWVDEVMPIDAAGVMILDAASVVTQLKALPWQQAEQFMGRSTSGDAFENYELTGEGLAILKTKFTENKAMIIAKWDELSAWVAQQKASNP